MSNLRGRLSKLETKAASIAARSPDGSKLWDALEEVASRLNWSDISPAWVAGQSQFTILAAGFHCPQPMPDALKDRVNEFAGQNDTVGKLAQLILEFSE